MKINSFPRVNGHLSSEEIRENPLKPFSFNLNQFKNLTQLPVSSAQPRNPLDVSGQPAPGGFVEEAREWLRWPMEFEVGGKEFFIERWKFLIAGAALVGVGVFFFVR